jgi:hypothetical protein
MFPTVRSSMPSIEHVHRCEASLQRFMDENRKAGCSDSVLIGAFINMYMHLGSPIIGALRLAERIEAWDPEHQAKLRQVGLRSSYTCFSCPLGPLLPHWRDGTARCCG